MLCLPALAQVDRPSLNGTVTDPSGALVPEVKVLAVAADTGFQRTTLTGAAGTYQMAALSVGRYDITFVKPGFREVEFKDVDLSVGQPRTLDAVLQVGVATESVEVSAPSIP